MNFEDLPRSYSSHRLRRTDLLSDPKEQLLHWIKEAQDAQVKELNAMSLAIASKEGKPSCRMVLLKQIDDRGLIFFTNYFSRKSKELEVNPYVMVTLFWREVMRQISIEGVVEKISASESREYFSKRPRRSQLGAWASPQDQVIPSYETLETSLKQLEEKFKDREIPLPPFWGGFRIIPNRYEFWQGERNRLHDRFQYVLKGNNWTIDRIAP